MIVFDLVCENDHRFEGWFRNSHEFTAQRKSAMLICPVCGNAQVTKMASAGYLNLKHPRNEKSETRALKNQTNETLSVLREFITAHCENVGDAFAGEARKIHYGETRDRNICGTATAKEVSALREEGIDVLSLPVLREKEKLN